MITFEFTQILERVGKSVVGRRTEMAMILSAIRISRPVLLIGVPGVSKTTILRELTKEVYGENHLFTATGDEQLSVHGLVGTFDPSLVMKDGYRPEYFVPGPLMKAMQTGGVFYLEELNRTPSSTLNVLMTVLSDHYLDVPHYGRIHAKPGFCVVASSNPLDDIGTDRLSRGLVDRFLTLELTYQTQNEERVIVSHVATKFTDKWIDYSVQIARLSRQHSDLLYGASIRASIDFLLLLGELGPIVDNSMLLEVGVAAYAGRVSVRPSANRSAREVIVEIMQQLDVPPLDRLRDLWNQPGDNTGTGSQGGALVTAAESEVSGISGGAVQGEQHKDTRIDMAWESAGSGGTQGPSNRKPNQQSFLQFGTTQDVARLSERRATHWVDQNVLQEWVRASYSSVRGGTASSVGAPRGPVRTVPLFVDPSAELDVPATLYNFAVGLARQNQIMVRRRSRISRRFALFVDHSGSMIGSKLMISAALASVLTKLSAVQHMRLGVYAFDQGIQPIKELSEAKNPDKVIDEILRLSEGRSTDIGGVFRYSASLLERWPDCEVILVSDCMPTRGEKTFAALRSLASKLPKLFILQVSDSSGKDFGLSHPMTPQSLDLYGLWGWQWAGPERFRSLNGIQDLPEAVHMIVNSA